MARDFDGANDNLTTADNAVTGIDTDEKSWAAWLVMDAQPGALQFVYVTMIAAGAGNARLQIAAQTPASAGYRPQVQQTWTTTGGTWRVDDDVPLNTLTHLAVVLDRALGTNDPTIYINGTSVAFTETFTPAGTLSTGDDTIRVGESAAGTADWDGTIGWVTQQASLWTSDEVNRHRWWGMAPGGPSTMEVWYPLVTTDLAQKGTGGGALTASGTTVVSLPRVPRSGCAGVW